jgi:hypothetical protein
MTPPADGSAPVPNLVQFVHDVRGRLGVILHAAAIIQLVPDQDSKVTGAVGMIERQAGEILKLLDQLAPRRA